MTGKTTISDVARVAGVSAATVSNVLNRPSAVAPPTRERVLGAIGVLGFERNEHAASLRLGTRSKAATEADVVQARDVASVPEVGEEAHPAGARVHGNMPTTIRSPRVSSGVQDLSWQDIPACRAVNVQLNGRDLGSGVTDGSMPDGSGLWVRFDDGCGRRLLIREDGYEILDAVGTPQ